MSCIMDCLRGASSVPAETHKQYQVAAKATPPSPTAPSGLTQVVTRVNSAASGLIADGQTQSVEKTAADYIKAAVSKADARAKGEEQRAAAYQEQVQADLKKMTEESENAKAVLAAAFKLNKEKERALKQQHRLETSTLKVPGAGHGHVQHSGTIHVAACRPPAKTPYQSLPSNTLT